MRNQPRSSRAHRADQSLAASFVAIRSDPNSREDDGREDEEKASSEALNSISMLSIVGETSVFGNGGLRRHRMTQIRSAIGEPAKLASRIRGGFQNRWRGALDKSPSVAMIQARDAQGRSGSHN